MADFSWRIRVPASPVEVLTEQVRQLAPTEQKELIAGILIDLRASGCDLDRATEEVAGEAPTVILRR